MLTPFFHEVFHIDIQEDVLGSDGVNWGSTDFEGPTGE